MVKAANQRYVQRGPEVPHQRRGCLLQVYVAQCICRPGRLGWEVDLYQEEGGAPTYHTEMGEKTPRSITVEGDGVERRRQFHKPFSSYVRLVASCSFGVIFSWRSLGVSFFLLP